jgi:hypothetical protein
MWHPCLSGPCCWSVHRPICMVVCSRVRSTLLKYHDVLCFTVPQSISCLYLPCLKRTLNILVQCIAVNIAFLLTTLNYIFCQLLQTCDTSYKHTVHCTSHPDCILQIIFTVRFITAHFIP